MKSDGLIKRHVHSGMPLRVEYEPTEKAEKLRLVLEQMSEFSAQYCAADIFRDKKPRTFEQALETTGRGAGRYKPSKRLLAGHNMLHVMAVREDLRPPFNEETAMAKVKVA